MAFDDHGRNACELGNGTIISCHESKPLGRGEGGAIVMRRDCAAFPYLGRVHAFNNNAFNYAFNWRMPDIAAAFLAARIEALTPTAYARAHANALAVDTALQHADVAPHVRWAVVPRCDRTLLACLWLWTAVPVDNLAAFSAAHNIEARRFYVPLVGADLAPHATTWYRHTVTLPFLYDCNDTVETTRGVFALAAWVQDCNAPRV